MTFRPMLAAEADLDKVKFPIILQPKYDGIRCLLKDGEAVSRTLKSIPNKHIQNTLSHFVSTNGYGLDGEILTYTEGRVDGLHTVQSKVMAVNGRPEFVFHVFDRHDSDDVYMDRYDFISRFVGHLSVPYLEYAPNRLATSVDQLNDYEEELVSGGWEGMIGRKPDGLYKMGRSTRREGLLLKFKRFQDSEGVVVGYEELERNHNEAELDERGLQKRSSHKDGKVAGGILGALILRWNDVEFKVGSGFDEEQRVNLWNARDSLLGHTVTFKYKGLGPNGKPLIASFKAFRYDVPAAKPKAVLVSRQGNLFE